VKKTHYCLLLLVKIADDWLGVVLGACCEDIYVVVLTHICEKLKTKWSDVEFELITFMCEFDICFLIGENGVD
jgi:hypothetical protein